MTAPDPWILEVMRTRLVRREVSLLTAYGLFGRHPRVQHAAYWRASFTPLALAAMFFASRAVGVADPQAALIAGALLAGLVLADMQLFVINAPAWIFARQMIRWPVLADLAEAYTGIRPKFARQGPTQSQSRWEHITLSPAHRQALAKGYQQMRNTPLALAKLISASAEFRVLVLSSLILLVVLTVSPALSSFALAVFSFVIAWPAKRLKAGIDLWLTWPVLRDLFDWQKIDQAAAGGR